MSDDTAIAETTFDPAKHLRKIRGKGGESDYLDVKYRIAWFRDQYPTGSIETEAVELSDQLAIFRATVRKVSPDGVIEGTATGYGSETPKDFGDYLEKAETKAIGRALAHLGYGTAAAMDEDGERIVDAPVDQMTRSNAPQRAQPRQATPTPIRQENAPQGSGQPPTNANLLTERQRKMIFAAGREAGIEPDDLERWSLDTYGCSIGNLTRRDASAFIDQLLNRRGDVPEGAAATPAQPATTPAQQQAINALKSTAKEVGLNHDDLHAIVVSRGVASLKDLSTEQALQFRNWLKQRTPAQLRAALRKAGRDVPDEPPATTSEPLPDDLEVIAQQTDAQMASRSGTAGNDRYTQ